MDNPFLVIDGTRRGGKADAKRNRVTPDDNIVPFAQWPDAAPSAAARERRVLRVLEELRPGETGCVIAFEFHSVLPHHS